MFRCCRPQLKVRGWLPMLTSYAMILFSSKLIKMEMGLFLVLNLLYDVFRLMCKFTAYSKETGKKWLTILF